MDPTPSNVQSNCSCSIICYGVSTVKLDDLTTQHHHIYRPIRRTWRLSCMVRDALDGRSKTSTLPDARKREPPAFELEVMVLHVKQLHLIIEICARSQCNHDRHELS
jgi:hypothetical protein